MTPARKEPELDTYRGRFAARLKMLREKAGLSVEEAADKLIESKAIKNPRTIYFWESARGLPKIELLPLIAEAYSVKSPRTLLPEK